MKHLTLIRHAKSSWSDPRLEDAQRPLNARGMKNAPLMGGWLARRGFNPDRLVASPALRAHTTALLLAEALGYPVAAIGTDARLYLAGLDDLLALLRDVDDALGHLALVGHNPGLTELVNHLGHRPIDNLPTCGVCTLELPVSSWKEIGAARGTIVAYDTPKSIKPLLHTMRKKRGG